MRREFALLLLLLLSWHVEAGMFYSKFPRVNNLTTPTTYRPGYLADADEVAYGIQEIAGQDCCNECLFLPDLQPCGYFVNAMTYSKMPTTYDNPYGPPYQSIPKFRNYIKYFTQFDDIVMCFTGPSSSPWAIFGTYQQNPTLLTTPVVMEVMWGGWDDASGAQAFYRPICSATTPNPDGVSVQTLCGDGNTPHDLWVDQCHEESFYDGEPVVGAWDTPGFPNIDYCTLGDQVTRKNNIPPMTAKNTQRQFIQTFFLNYTNETSAWVSFFRQGGRSIASLTYDLGKPDGTPVYVPTGLPGENGLGSMSGHTLTENTAFTTCNTSALCLMDASTIDNSKAPVNCPFQFGQGTTFIDSGYRTYKVQCDVNVGLDKVAWPIDTFPLPNQISHSTRIWCDAPIASGNTACTGNLNSPQFIDITSGTMQIDRDRGCIGYGMCPQDINGATCGNTSGSCMHNGKCYCKSGYGGQACDELIPVPPGSNLHNYTCALFDPCSGNGFCQDTPDGPGCVCYDGWRGSRFNGITLSPLDGTPVNGEINIYNNAFICATSQSTCSGYQQALDYMLDHQCLFFVDTPEQGFINRYFRTTGNLLNARQNSHLDWVFTDDRFVTGQYAYSFQPLWFSGNSDLQLFDGELSTGRPVDLSRITTQVIARGYNCIDGRTVADKSTLPPEDLPNGVLRGGPSCLPCPPCVTNQSVCDAATGEITVFLPNAEVLFVSEMVLKAFPHDPIIGILTNGYINAAIAVCPLNRVSVYAYPGDVTAWIHCAIYPMAEYCHLHDPFHPMFGPASQRSVEACRPYVYGALLNAMSLLSSDLSEYLTTFSCSNTVISSQNAICSTLRGFPTQRACFCFDNFGHSNISNPICDAPICPWNTTLTVNPCGAPLNGTCIPTNGTSPYLGYCQCHKGYTGPSCEIQVCPTTDNGTDPAPTGLGPNLMCGGFEHSVTNIDPSQYSALSIAPALDCNMVTRSCVCNEPFWRLNPVTGLCDLVGCPSDANGLECHGLVVFGSSSRAPAILNSVCDRVRSTTNNLATCRCYLARQLTDTANQQPLVSFYGSCCDQPYSKTTVCTSPVSGLYCGGSATATCFLNGTDSGIVPVDPTAPPSCHCPATSLGQWCDSSLCNPTAKPGYDCSADPFHPTGDCQGCVDCQEHDNNCCSVSCNSPSCQWKCRCYFVDPANLYRICDDQSIGISTSPTCTFYSNRNPWDPFRARGIPCVYPLTGCSYYDNVRSPSQWTVCGFAGESACMVNSTGNGLSCNCSGTAYSGTYCQTLLACGGFCSTGTCDTKVDPKGICNCLPSYSGNTTGCTASSPCCSVPACGSGKPGTMNANSTCSCPTNSTFTYFGSTQAVSPYCYAPEIGTFKGCSLTCPTRNGFECGGCGYKTRNGFISRCSSHTILALSNASAPTCDCTMMGLDLTSTSGVSIPWTMSLNGACEPYCYPPGGTFSGINVGVLTWNETAYTGLTTVCTCNPGWSGPRCNVNSVNCANGGYPTYSTSPPSCICGKSQNPNLPYTSDSNCTVAFCNATTSYYDATQNLDRCTCIPPYAYSTTTDITCSNVCRNGGIPNTTTGTCTCSGPFYGTFCDKTDCTNSNPTESNCICPLANQILDPTIQRCVHIDCQYGTQKPDGTCECYPTFSGQFCTDDLCAIGSSYGVSMINATSGAYYCDCWEGYSQDGDGWCTLDACGAFGIPFSCPITVYGIPFCPFPGFDYMCACGNGTFGPDPVTGVPTCISPKCAPHGNLINLNGLGICQCFPGWNNDPTDVLVSRQYCSKYSCNAATSYYDVNSQICACYPPFSNPPACTDYQTICGQGSGYPVLLNEIATGGGSFSSIFTLASFYTVAYQCNCSDPLVLSLDPRTFINGAAPCVLNCSVPGTDFAQNDSCLCNRDYNGTYCETYNGAVIIAANTNPDATLATWQWVLIAIGCSITIVTIGLLVFHFINKSHPTWLQSKRKKSSKKNKNSKKSARQDNL